MGQSCLEGGLRCFEHCLGRWKIRVARLEADDMAPGRLQGQDAIAHRHRLRLAQLLELPIEHIHWKDPKDRQLMRHRAGEAWTSVSENEGGRFWPPAGASGYPNVPR